MERNYDVTVQFGLVLKKYRESRGMSQLIFAEKCGIAPSYYGKVELGKHNISLVNCWKIAEALNISLADLFSDLQY